MPAARSASCLKYQGLAPRTQSRPLSMTFHGRGAGRQLQLHEPIARASRAPRKTSTRHARPPRLPPTFVPNGSKRCASRSLMVPTTPTLARSRGRSWAAASNETLVTLRHPASPSPWTTRIVAKGRVLIQATTRCVPAAAAPARATGRGCFRSGPIVPGTSGRSGRGNSPRNGSGSHRRHPAGTGAHTATPGTPPAR